MPPHIDHHDLLLAAFGGQPLHHPGEHPHVAPPLPPVVKGLGWTILPRRVAPSQAIAVDEDFPLSTRRSSTRGLPWLLGKKGRSRSICASVSQKRLLIITPSVRTLESRRPDGLKQNNGS
jgi:hypothetical protein